jgi:antitoxin HicB
MLNGLKVMKSHQQFAIDYFQDEDGKYTAQVPAIPGCLAWGDSLEDAHRAAIEAIESCLEARAEVGAPIADTRYDGLNVYHRSAHA